MSWARPGREGSAAPAVEVSEGPASDPLRHRRVSLHLDGGARLDFVDQRIFGHLSVQPLAPAHGRLVPASAIHIAPDPLEDAFDVEATVDALASKRTPIKAALLDQTLVSGIGNIYADEALFRAGVHPLALPARTRRSRLAAVLESATTVMGDALAVGGTSFDALYVNVDGRSGYFARSLNAYGKEGEPCPRCGTFCPTKKTITRKCLGPPTLWP